MQIIACTNIHQNYTKMNSITKLAKTKRVVDFINSSAPKLSNK